MIILKNLGFDFRADTWAGKKRRLFDDINITFPDRAFVAILGGAGSGKSTLLRLICGSMLPTRGLVQRTSSVSFPVGFSGGSGRMSVLHYIQYVARCYCVDSKSLVRFVLEFAELEDVLHRQLGKLEPDPRSRLYVTIGYALPFDHYLFDARIAVGDADFRAKCLKLFEARRRRSGILLATRVPSLARQYCSSAVIIQNGSLLYFADINRGIDYYEMVDPDQATKKKSTHYVPTETSFFDDPELEFS